MGTRASADTLAAMRSPLPPRDGITAARLRAPGGLRTHARAHEPVPATVGQWLTADFPQATEAEIASLVDAGELTAEDGSRVALADPVVPGGFYFFHRDHPAEERLPVELGVVYEDTDILIVDKPHFLASTPNGRFVRECALTRLRIARDEPDLVAVHRLDRVTAGLLMLSRRPETRGAYQRLFQDRRIDKRYRALAALDESHTALRPGASLCRATRLEKAAGERAVREVDGPANARTEIRCERVVGETSAGLPVAEFALTPLTGKTHQLRVHLCALGAPILGDPVYPVDLAPDPYDLSSPLQLLAESLAFDDSVTGERREFRSRLALDPHRW